MAYQKIKRIITPEGQAPSMSQLKGISRGKSLVIFFSILILCAVSLLPTPPGLSPEGQRAIGVFAMAVVLWATAALPLSVTGIVVMAALPLLKVVEERAAYSYFGNSAVFFILGAFMLAAAMMKTGLSMRIALLILERFSSSPGRLIAGVLLTTASLAFIMPEHAVAAILFPVVVEIARSLELEPLKSRYGVLLFLSLAWGSVIGGIATLLGGARNPLALGLLSEYYGLEISFYQWMFVAAPLTLVMLLIAYIVVVGSFGIDIEDVSTALSTIAVELEAKGRFSEEERRAAYVMGMTLFAWIFLGSRLGLANIALLGSALLFPLGVMDWKDVEEYVNWGVILMYGGAIALGSALVSTGAASWLAEGVLEKGSLSALSFLLLVSILSKLLTEGISNTATVAIILPIAFSIGTALGINPIATVFMVALPSGLAFTLPIATPPNAIAYSSGYYEISDIIKPGLLLNILSWIAFIAMAMFYWPRIGLTLVMR